MVKTAEHRCEDFAQERGATFAKPYHFVDSGLPNVYLAGIRYFVCRKCGQQAAEIPAVQGLLSALARAIIEKEGPLLGAEIRFLRKRLAKKAAEFGQIIGVTAEEVSRWENGSITPAKSADKLIRVYYCVLSGDHKLKEKLDEHIDEWLRILPGEKGAEKKICASRDRKRKWKAEPVAA